MPEERIDADLGLGRHADAVGELKALVEFRDEQDAGSDAARRRFARASACAGVELAPPTDDEGKSPSTLRSRPLQTPRARAGTATSRTVEPRRTASVLRASRQTPGWDDEQERRTRLFPLDEAAARERPLGAPLATAQDVKEE